MLRFLTAFPIALALAGCATIPASPPAPVEIGIVAINDFHGAIEPPRISVTIPDGQGNPVGIPAGGGAWLASAVDSIRSRYGHTITVGAGDLISASQFASSAFLDEPAIGVLDRLGLEYSALGNHEFDRGRAELLRVQNGGCEQTARRKPCAVEQFGGAKFRYLAANVATETGATLFPASAMKTFGTGTGTVKVGIVGLPLRRVPGLVVPDSVKGLTFGDEADAINRETTKLKVEGADAVIVLIHEGGRLADTSDPQGCAGFSGDILPILDRLSPAIDVVVSGHTHAAYICERDLPGRTAPLLLTSAGAQGALVTDIALTIDPVSGSVTRKRARNVIVQSAPYTSSRGTVSNSDLAPRFDPRRDVADYVGRYVEAAKELSGRKAGSIAGTAGRGNGDGGSLGNLIADAQLAATRSAGAQISFMNPGGIRAASLVPAPDGSVTFGELYQIQPFGNELRTFSLSGAELKAVLEQGFDDQAPMQVLSPSAGFFYTYDLSRPIGSRIVGMTFEGKPINPAATYRVTVSNFLAQGGDSFTRFTAGRDVVPGGVDLDALEAWLSVEPARTVPEEARTQDLTKR